MRSVDVYRPFFHLYRLVGCMPGITGKPVPQPEDWFFCEYPLSWHSLAYGLQHFYAVHYVFRCFFRMGEEDFWPTFVEFLRVVVAVITVHNFTERNKEFHKVISNLDLVPGLPNENEYMARRSRRFLVGYCIYLLGRMILDIMKVVAPVTPKDPITNPYYNASNFTESEFLVGRSLTRLERYTDSYWYHTDISSVDSAGKFFIALIGSVDVATSRLLVTASVGFSMCCFVTLSYHFYLKYKCINDELNERMEQNYKAHCAGTTIHLLTTNDLLNYRQRYALLAENISLTNYVFNKCAFMWFAAFLSGFCAEITALFSEMAQAENEQKKKTDDDPLVELNVTIDGLYLLFWMSNFCFFAAKLQESSTASLRTLHHLTSLHPPEDVDVAIQSGVLFTQLNFSRVGLTAGNFFYINREAVMTTSTALITYVVVVIQMNPVAIKMLLDVTTSSANDTEHMHE